MRFETISKGKSSPSTTVHPQQCRRPPRNLTDLLSDLNTITSTISRDRGSPRDIESLIARDSCSRGGGGGDDAKSERFVDESPTRRNLKRASLTTPRHEQIVKLEEYIARKRRTVELGPSGDRLVRLRSHHQGRGKPPGLSGRTRRDESFRNARAGFSAIRRARRVIPTIRRRSATARTSCGHRCSR